MYARPHAALSGPFLISCRGTRLQDTDDHLETTVLCVLQAMVTAQQTEVPTTTVGKLTAAVRALGGTATKEQIDHTLRRLSGKKVLKYERAIGRTGVAG